MHAHGDDQLLEQDTAAATRWDRTVWQW